MLEAVWFAVMKSVRRSPLKSAMAIDDGLVPVGVPEMTLEGGKSCMPESVPSHVMTWLRPEEAARRSATPSLLMSAEERAVTLQVAPKRSRLELVRSWPKEVVKCPGHRPNARLSHRWRYRWRRRDRDGRRR